MTSAILRQFGKAAAKTSRPYVRSSDLQHSGWKDNYPVDAGIYKAQKIWVTGVEESGNFEERHTLHSLNF
jgi:hypothetical protein